MRPFFIPACIATLLLSTLIHADISITSPVQGTTWTLPTARITWMASPTFSPTATHTVDLMRGNPQALLLVKSLGTVKESDGGMEVKVEVGWGDGGDFVVKVGDKYSHAFRIQVSGSPKGGMPKGGNATNGTNGTIPSVNATKPVAPPVAPPSGDTTNATVTPSTAAVQGASVTTAMAALVPVMATCFFY